MPLMKSKSKQAFGKNVATEMEAGKPQKQSLAIAYDMQRRAPKKMAEGGEVTPMDLMDDDERATSIADAIMRKRKMATGGEVDIEDNGEDQAADESMDDEFGLKELYDDSQLSDQPLMSKGDDIEADKHDMVSAIRAKLKAKRGL